LIVVVHWSFDLLSQWRWDPILYIVKLNANKVDQFFLGAGILLLLYTLVLQIVLYFLTKNTISSLGYYDLVVNCTDIYLNCRLSDARINCLCWREIRDFQRKHCSRLPKLLKLMIDTEC